NQWNACAAKTASTEASASGIPGRFPGAPRPLDRLSPGVGAWVGWLDGDDPAECGNEQPRQLARARPKVEHGCTRCEPSDVDDLGWPPWPATLVIVRPEIAATRGHGPG